MALTKLRGNTQIKAGTITNVEISSDAAIELSKLAEGAELIKRDGSVAFTGDVDLASHKLVNVAEPVSASDASTKSYVDTEVSAEETRAIAAENNLADLIVFEQEDRIVAVAAEEARALAAEGVLADDISALEAADVLLDGRVTDLENGLSAETQNRENADVTLQGNIDDVAADLAQEVLDRAADVDAEEARALAAEDALATEDLTFIKIDGSRDVTGVLYFDESGIINGAAGREGATVVNLQGFTAYEYAAIDGWPGDWSPPAPLPVGPYESLTGWPVVHPITGAAGDAFAFRSGFNAFALQFDGPGDGWGNLQSETPLARYGREGLYINNSDVDFCTITGSSALFEKYEGLDPDYAPYNKTWSITGAGMTGSSKDGDQSFVLAANFMEMTSTVQEFSLIEGNVYHSQTAITNKTFYQTAMTDDGQYYITIETGRIKLLLGESPALPVDAEDVVVKAYVDDLVSAEETRALAAEAQVLSDANAYTDAEIAALVNSAPAVLDTLKELSDALGGDENFATTVASQIADIAADVTAEETRALAAEGVLQGNIDDVAADLAQEVLDRAADVTSEETRALAAEGVLAGDISALDGRMDTAEADIVALEGRMDNAESSIVSLDGRLDTAEADIVALEAADVALDGRLDTAEADIVALEGRMDTAESDIAALESSVLYVANVKTREAPSGSIDGSNAEFSLAHTPVLNSEHVYLNGLLQEPGVGNDYSISGGTITFSSAPVSGDRIRVSYIKA